jgi:hypothetical protein
MFILEWFTNLIVLHAGTAASFPDPVNYGIVAKLVTTWRNALSAMENQAWRLRLLVTVGDVQPEVLRGCVEPGAWV